LSLLALDLTTGPVLAGVAALAILALLVVWFVPKWQARRWASAARPALTTKDIAELENGARTTIVQLVGGIALILTFAATWMQIADARRAANRTLKLTEASQQTERFTRGVNELSAGGLELRLGGLFGLGRVGMESPLERQPIFQIVLSYLRRHHALRPLGEAVVANRVTARRACSVSPRPGGDVQATLSVVLDLQDALREETTPENRGDLFDLSELDLTGVRARKRDFSGDDLHDTRLISAHLEGADFTGATLTGTDFRGACLTNAHFDDTTIVLTKFAGADLEGADFSKSSTAFPSAFRNARLTPSTRLPEGHPPAPPAAPGASGS
jgi:hypothetical protein